MVQNIQGIFSYGPGHFRYILTWCQQVINFFYVQSTWSHIKVVNLPVLMVCMMHDAYHKEGNNFYFWSIG